MNRTTVWSPTIRCTEWTAVHYGSPLRPAPTRREPNAYGPKRHKAVDVRLDNCPTRRCLACLKSGASCSTLLATERSWPRVSATALTHWSITIGSLWPDASSGRWGRVAAGLQLHTDACWTRLVGAGLYPVLLRNCTINSVVTSLINRWCALSVHATRRPIMHDWRQNILSSPIYEELWAHLMPLTMIISSLSGLSSVANPQILLVDLRLWTVEAANLSLLSSVYHSPTDTDCIWWAACEVLLLDHWNLGFILSFGDSNTESQHLTTMVHVVRSLQWSQYHIHSSGHFTINIIRHDKSSTDKLRPTVSH